MNFKLINAHLYVDAILFFKTKDQHLENIRAFEPPGQCKEINLFVIGSIGSGKSLLVNILATVLRNNNQIATTAVAYGDHGESLTSNVSLNSYINEITLLGDIN